MSAIKKMSGSKVSFSLTVEKADIEKSQKAVIEHLKKNTEVKGFRKGHAPEEAVMAQAGMQNVYFESLNRAVDKKYRAFIQEHNVAVINQPSVKFPEKEGKEGSMEIGFEVEVFPEVKLGDYKKLKIGTPKVEVTNKEVEDVLMTLASQMQLGKPVERAAKKGDLLDIDFEGKDEKGEVLPSTAGKNQQVRIGMGHFLEDLENAFVGMKAGDKKDKVPVKFPKNYHSKDFAGKTIPFDIALHQVMELDPSSMNEETIEKISGKKQSMDDLKAEIKNTITQNKSQTEKQALVGDYQQKLAKIVKVELPQSWVDKEIESRLERIKQSPQFQHDPEAFWKQMGKDEAALKKEFATQGANDLKVFLGLSEIVKAENIELDKDETERASQIASQQLQGETNPAHLQAEMDKASLNLKIDKYLDSLMMA